MKRIILLTGSPGVGKTTVLMKTVETLKAKGLKVGGMLSREVRSSGIRIGFEIADLSGDERGWLAHVDQGEGPQVGKYHVNLGDLNRIGVAAIEKAIETCDVVAIDEIGPMELFSNDFKKVVIDATQSTKIIIATIHWKESNRLVCSLNNRENLMFMEVTWENREKLPELIVKEVTGSV